MFTQLEQHKLDEITQLQDQASKGNNFALDQLMPIIYAAKKKLSLKRNALQVEFDISDIPSDFEAEWMIQLNEIIESIEKLARTIS